MCSQKIWKRLTCFILAFGTGVLIEENLFVGEIQSYGSEQLKMEFHRPQNASKPMEFVLPPMFDCEREYVVIPLAQSNIRSEILEQSTDGKKTKKVGKRAHKNGPPIIVRGELLRPPGSEDYGTPNTLLYSEHCFKK